MCEEEPRVPRQRNPADDYRVPDMTADEAIATYQEWRIRVIGNRKTKADTMEELYAQLRDPED
jgi:hypothetical protein